MKNTLFTTILFLFVSFAHAQQQANTGKVSQIDAVAGAGGAPGNYDFRVFLVGNPTLCAAPNQPYWAYVNTNDANYKTITSLVTVALLTGKTIVLHAAPAANGYCQITYLAVSS